MWTVDFLMDHRLLVVVLCVVAALHNQPASSQITQAVLPSCVSSLQEAWQDRLDTSKRVLEGQPYLRGARLGSPGEPGLVVDFQGGNITVVVGEEEEEGEARLVRSFGEASIEARIQFDSSGSTVGSLFISVTNSSLNCSYLVESSQHGGIVYHPVYRTLAFSPSGDQLAYLAEIRQANTFWTEESPEMGGNFWPYSVRNPGLFVVNVATREVTALPLPQGHVAGASVWTPDGSGIVTVTRPRKSNPCPECTDTPSRLALVTLETRTVSLLSPPACHASLPLLSPSGSLLYFSIPLTTQLEGQTVPAALAAPQDLVLHDLEGDMTTVVATGLRPAALRPWGRRAFLQDGRLVLSSRGAQGLDLRLVVVELAGGSVRVVADGTGEVLDVEGDVMLTLHTSVERGLELRLGTLREQADTTVSASTTEAGTSTHSHPHDHSTTEVHWHTTTEGPATEDTTIVEDTTTPQDTTVEGSSTTPADTTGHKDPCQALLDSLLAGLESGDLDATTEEPDILTTHGSTDGHTTHGHTTHGPTTHGPHTHGPTTHEPTTHTHTTQPHGQGTTQAATATGMTQEDTTHENTEVDVSTQPAIPELMLDTQAVVAWPALHGARDVVTQHDRSGISFSSVLSTTSSMGGKMGPEDDSNIAEEGSVEDMKNNSSVEDSNGAIEDSNGAIEDSNGATEDSNGAIEDSNGATEDNTPAIEDNTPATSGHNHIHALPNTRLLVFIPDHLGNSLPLPTLYLWLAMGWDVLQVNYHSSPAHLHPEVPEVGDHLEAMARDVHQAVESAGEYSARLLLGHRLGGSLAANLAARHPAVYRHLVLVDAALSLPSLVLSRPSLLRQALSLQADWFTGSDLANAWAASPLGQIENITAASLLITSRQETTKQAQAFIERQVSSHRGHRAASELYTVPLLQQSSLLTTSLMVEWSERHYSNYEEQCSVTDSPTTEVTGSSSYPTQGGEGGGSETATASSSSLIPSLPFPLLLLLLLLFLLPL